MDRSTERLIALMLICFAMAVILPRTRYTAWGSANTKSRMATVEALVHHGTYAIDASPYNKTMDRVKLDGKLYSSKPPMLPTLVAGAYYVIHHTTGMSFAGKGRAKRYSAVHATLSVLFSGTSLVAFLVFLYLSSCLITRDPFARLLTLGTGAFGFFGAGYAVDINNHLPATAVGMAAIAVVLSIQQRREEAPNAYFVGAGLLLGLLPTLDIPSALMSIGLGGWLLLTQRRRALMFAMPVSLIPIAAHMAMTFSYSGGVLPVQMRADAWERKPSGPRINRFVYFFHTTLGVRGIFSMVPMLGPAGIGLYRSLKQRRALAGPLALILLVVFVIQAWFYLRRNNYGGTCVGSRWFIPIIGWSLLYVAVFAEALREKALDRRWWFFLPLALTVGAANMGSAANNPWAISGFQQLFTPRMSASQSEDYNELRRKKKKKKKKKEKARSKAERAKKAREAKAAARSAGTPVRKPAAVTPGATTTPIVKTAPARELAVPAPASRPLRPASAPPQPPPAPTSSP